MLPHPPVLRRPVVIWRGASAFDSVARRHSALYPLRPDWFAEAVAGKPLSAAACRIAFAHPLCAAALLERDYPAYAAELEPALQGDGESVSHLLNRAREAGTLLHRPSPFYRRILREDPYWGQRFAQRSRDPALTGEITRWSEERRHVSGAAAAWFLIHRPREPVEPYGDLIRANPFYAYIALPQLHPRGFKVGAADAPTARWAFHFSRSVFARDEGSYADRIQSDPAWHVEQLGGADHPLETAEAQRVMAGLLERHAQHPLLERALQAVRSLTPSLASPSPLRAGRSAETHALSALQREKNREIWRPSPEQVVSPEFKQIVGLPRYTERGFARGTILDSVEGELAEIKSGSSALSATYQLRLQAYRAWAESRPLKIYTNRPIDPEFERWRKPLGVAIEPLPP
jgi:hypothetical protein